MRDTDTIAQQPQQLATRDEVAAFLRIAPRTLEQWAYRGQGPRYTRVGRTPRYEWADVRTWLAEQQQAGGGAAA